MIEILYEDDVLIVLNKPAGIATLAKDEGSASLSEELVSVKPELKEVPDNGIAHRLDNNTSGIICAGTTNEAYEHLRNQFSKHMPRKHYLALVLGGTPDFDEIDLPIAHHPRKKAKMVVCESMERAFELKARKAQTRYDVVGRYIFKDTSYTLLHVTIMTGVRHQIRVHLAARGFPIAGDNDYQNAKKRAEDALPIKRHFLHASKLEIDHPSTNKRMTFECPLPKDLAEVLKQAKPV